MRDERADEVERAVLALLDRRGPTPIDEILAGVDGHPIEIEHACSRLQRAGELRSRSCGVYARPTDDGGSRRVAPRDE
ncbi:MULTISPECIES: hypothetical protein [Haloferax]|uniref:hypothetical protein n=1 Tax=Haloferax TaxID=2251 RepID=UPI001F2403E7|nr:MULTISPECIES: hypothetical protein [Haloferax]